MNIEKLIADHSQKAIQHLYGLTLRPEEIQIQSTRKEFEGDLTLVVFPFVKSARKSPEQVANEIGDYLMQEVDLVIAYNSVKGFLNLVIVWI